MLSLFETDFRDFQKITDITSSIKSEAEQAGNALYHELLSQEIETLVDNIALNIIPRPDKENLLKTAALELNRKISYAMASQGTTRYNLMVTEGINPQSDKTYFRIFTPNECLTQALRKRLRKISELKPISDSGKLPPSVCVFTVRLYPVDEPAPDLSTLQFQSPQKRAQVIARHNMSNRLLSQISGGREIQNYQLMRYMDAVILELDGTEIKREIDAMEANLSGILPEITKQLLLG